MNKTIVTAGAFNEIGSQQIRFIHEISKQGNLNIILLDDGIIEEITGNKPKYPEAERRYYLESIRYVESVHTIKDMSELNDVSKLVSKPVDTWFTMDHGCKACACFQQAAEQQNIPYQIINTADLEEYPEHDYDLDTTTGRKVLVTGCFDWFHTGHIRFFEEASEHGDLYVVLGHDKNIEKLKGPGHPMFNEQQRKYIAGSIKFVKKALISSGDGWLDAEPEIKLIKPDAYVVNEDGNKDVKCDYCQQNGIEYIVLKRLPKPGLTKRTSTDLRGF